MKIREVFNSDKLLAIAPFVAKYTSKYGTILYDLKSLIHSHILKTKITKEPNMKDVIKNGLLIGTTTICNGNCTFCPYRYFEDKKESMDFNTFKKIIDDYYSCGGRKVELTPTQGEPLLDRGFFEKIKYLNKKGISCTFCTNGILLERNIEKLIKLKVKDIAIDIGDIIPENDSKVFQIPIELSKKKINSILKLLERAKETGWDARISIFFRPLRSPSKVFKDLKKSKFWKYYKEGLLYFQFLQVYDNWGGSITKKDLIGNQELKRPTGIRKFPCANFYKLAFLPNGDARVCGCRCDKTLKDDLVVGNINEISLKDIIKSKRWKDIIKNSKGGELPSVCKKCSFFEPIFKND